MLRVREVEISLHNSSGGPEYLRTLEKHCWQCSANERSQNDLSYTTKKMSHVRVAITKNAWLGVTARYILVLRQFSQQAICRFSTQGISFQVRIAMICKERSIGLPWFSTKPQIMTLFA